MIEKLLDYSLRPPNSLDTMMSEDLIHLVAKYKFVLALENGVCNDYITEKIWRPLIAGAVPIYIGSPTIHVRTAHLLVFINFTVI